MRKDSVEKSTSDSAVAVKSSSHKKAVSDIRLNLLKTEAKSFPQDLKSFKCASDKQTFSRIDHQLSDSGTIMKKNESENTFGNDLKNQKSRSNPDQKDLRLRKVGKGPNKEQDFPVQERQSRSQHNSENLKPIDSDTKNTLQSEEEEKYEKPEKGSVRNPEKNSQSYYLCWMILTMLSMLTRFYDIAMPAHVCWDETHFGKMGSWYINRTFFFDVHPPLGKMLIGLAGLSTGYDGSFPFDKPGDPFGETNYVGMRMFCAFLGALLVPLAYQSVWLLTHSVLAGMFAGAIILLDTGMLALSRHILLDPLLMFFILLSFYCCLKALSYKQRPFSGLWWLWMCATGIALACAIGVKFVGLFIVLFVGYTTAADLWSLMGDLSISMVKLFFHLSARAVCLIALPVFVYSLFFAVHFKVLNQSGNGDGFFSSAFQSQLIGNKLYNVSMPQYIAFGSEITLKQRRTGGAYLHSHSHLYPEDYPPRQQQVTTYSHKDENNVWLIKPADKEMTAKDYEAVHYVHSGDLVRLQHITTGRNLHSHKEQAPMTKHHYQVSGYGHNGSGDANDIWIVEVSGGSRGEKIQTVRSKIKFIHYNVGCLLHSHDKKLPKWGWEQMEVTCQTDSRDTTSAWNVEEVRDSRLSNVSFNVYAPSFMEMFLESHAVMTQGNSGLKPKEGEVTSQPWQWPIDYRGQMFSGPNHRVYLLGNPILFWSLLGLKVVFVFLWLGFSVCNKRGIFFSKLFKTYSDHVLKVCWWLLFAWFLHYAPFWTMGRVLYFHHYFPAFLFSAMFGGVILDFLLTLMCVCVPSKYIQHVFIGGLAVILSVMAFSLYLFYPLVYGMSGPTSVDPNSIMHGLKWLESWDI